MCRRSRSRRGENGSTGGGGCGWGRRRPPAARAPPRLRSKRAPCRTSTPPAAVEAGSLPHGHPPGCGRSGLPAARAPARLRSQRAPCRTGTPPAAVAAGPLPHGHPPPPDAHNSSRFNNLRDLCTAAGARRPLWRRSSPSAVHNPARSGQPPAVVRRSTPPGAHNSSRFRNHRDLCTAAGARRPRSPLQPVRRAQPREIGATSGRCEALDPARRSQLVEVPQPLRLVHGHRGAEAALARLQPVRRAQPREVGATSGRCEALDPARRSQLVEVPQPPRPVHGRRGAEAALARGPRSRLRCRPAVHNPARSGQPPAVVRLWTPPGAHNSSRFRNRRDLCTAAGARRPLWRRSSSSAVHNPARAGQPPAVVRLSTPPGAHNSSRFRNRRDLCTSAGARGPRWRGGRFGAAPARPPCTTPRGRGNLRPL